MLTILVVFGSGLALFAALTVAGWICRSLLEPSLDRRLERNRKAYHLQEPPSRNGHSRYSQHWPHIRKPYQKKVR